MGIIQQQSILNSLVTYAGIALGFVTTLYLYPNILTQDQYGLTRLMLSVSFIFTQFAQLGVNNIAIRFFPYFRDKEKSHNGFFAWVISIPLAGFLIFCLLFMGFESVIKSYYGEKSALFTEYFFYLIPLVFSMVYFSALNSYTRALYDSVPGSVINEIILRVLSIVLLVLYAFELINFAYFIVGFVLSYFLQPILLFTYLGFKGEIKLIPDFSFPTKKLIKEISNFGAFSLLGGMASLLVNNIDIIMLGSLKGLTDTAIYAIAFYIGSVIAVPMRSIGKIAPSLLAEHLKNDDLDEVERIYKSSSLNQIIAGSLFLIGIWANLHNLLAILPEKYAAAGPVIIIIGFAKLFDMAAGVNGNIILNSRHYRFDLYSMIFLVLLTITTNYYLIPPYGIIGAALATAISILVYNIIKCIYVWKRFRMQPFQLNTLPVLAISGGILFLSLQVEPLPNTYLDIFLRSGIIALLFCTFILSLNLSREIDKLWDSLKDRFY